MDYSTFVNGEYEVTFSSSSVSIDQMT